ncbi:MAG: hypothetical protein IPG22_05575 [Acidobacteria bacterium]|nr:hypothetical protein [Acidobacteriota bacterium]
MQLRGGIASQTLGNGLVHAIGYNTRLQPTSIQLGSSGATMSLSYTYGTSSTNNGNITSIAYSGGGTSFTQDFTYDNLNRLATAQEQSGSSWTQTNGYDRYGNRTITAGVGSGTAPTFSSTTNRITTSGYSYDAAGNLTVDPSHAYTYDAENKILKLDTVLAYAYDGEGKRVRKYVGENTRFVYGIGGELLAEYNGSTNAITKEYLYGASGLTAVIDPTNGTEYLTPDHLGSPRVVTNSSATVTQRRDFMPFGEEVTSGAGRSSGSGWSSVSAPRQKFTGYERDSESGLDFAQARYFGSSVGRFSSADPYNIVVDSSNRSDLNIYLKNAQNWNRYTYSLNNPLKIVDPSGLTPEPAFDWNKLSADERRILENSEFTVKQMIGENLEPIKLTGEALFDHLAANNPAALAGFLNQTAQLASITFNVDGGSRSALSFVDSVVGIAPDRIYATVGSELRTLVSKDPRFSRAPGHEGYDDSWKDNRSLKGKSASVIFQRWTGA